VPAVSAHAVRRRRLAVHRQAAGESGRNGNTGGQYICADLDYSRRVRTDIPPWLQTWDPDEVIFERTAALQSRLDGFADHVLRAT
jgi:treble-clef zinc-finger protein